jgi:hypothetical protein
VLVIGGFIYRVNVVRVRMNQVRLKAIDGPIDWIFHNALPVIGSVSLFAGGAGLIAGVAYAPSAIAGSTTLLLISGIYRPNVGRNPGVSRFSGQVMPKARRRRLIPALPCATRCRCDRRLIADAPSLTRVQSLQGALAILSSLADDDCILRLLVCALGTWSMSARGQQRRARRRGVQSLAQAYVFNVFGWLAEAARG